MTNETISAATTTLDRPSPVLRIEELKKHFRRADGTDVPAIDGVSLEVNGGEFVVLLGPSGCGKTTLLRCVAGLERPDTGRIAVRGTDVFNAAEKVNVPVERRALAMVFQSYALWPHMTVFDNIAYPLRSRGRHKEPKEVIRSRVQQIMDTVGIGSLGGQYPHQISGGQQQRVALSRALVAGSDVVLFDEPLSNIDAKVREQLRIELLSMQRDLGFAALFVTHDRQEAMALAHSVVVLDAGKISQEGTPREIYASPKNRYVANFIGPANEIGLSAVRAGESGYVVGTSALGEITGKLPAGAADLGLARVALWRPEAAHLSLERGSAVNAWECVIEQLWYSGSFTEYIVRVGEFELRATSTSGDEFAVGSTLWLSTDADDVRFVVDDLGSTPIEP